ncbi:MAG: alpha/beta fold hydrolase [Stellaceae bacterium]
MPYAQSGKVRLYYEEAGSGFPVLFIHEYASDHREWESQMRHFSRSYRAIAYSARGYPPSDVPEDDAAYGYEAARDDAAAVLAHLGINEAFIVGLSQGAYATLQFGLRYPQMARALVVAGVGSGSLPALRDEFVTNTRASAEIFLKEGSAKAADNVGVSPTRIQLKGKNPRAYEEFLSHLREHSNIGMALTGRNYQAKRPSLEDFADELRRLAMPVLLVCGDEDEPCIDTNLWLKRMIPGAGLWLVPRTGHAVNLEEPASFNREVGEFFATVEHDAWPPPR